MAFIPKQSFDYIQGQLIPEWQKAFGANILLIGQTPEGTSELQLSYDAGQPMLNAALVGLQKAGCDIGEVFIHLSPEISKMRSVYDVKSSFDLTEAIKATPGVVDVNISANGYIKLDTDETIADQDGIVVNVISVLQSLIN